MNQHEYPNNTILFKENDTIIEIWQQKNDVEFALESKG